VYKKDVDDFLEFAKRNGAAINERYYCPCVSQLEPRRRWQSKKDNKNKFENLRKKESSP